MKIFALFYPLLITFITILVVVVLNDVKNCGAERELLIKDAYNLWGSISGRRTEFRVDTGCHQTIAGEHVVRRHCDGSDSGCYIHVKLKGFKVSVWLEPLSNFRDDDVILCRDFISAVGAVTFELGHANGGWNLRDVYRQGTFNGYSATFLIDTGCRAGTSALMGNADHFCDGDFERNSDDDETTNFGGRDASVLGHCRATIVVLEKKVTQRFRVLSDASTEDVLLCVDVIKQLGSLTFKLSDTGSASLLSDSDDSGDDDDDNGGGGGSSSGGHNASGYYQNYQYPYSGNPWGWGQNYY